MRGVVLDRASLDRGDVDWSPLLKTARWEMHDATLPEWLALRLKDVEIAVSNKVVLDRQTLEAATSLRLVCIAATGTNNIDLAAARELNITVSNVRAYATSSVVQHVFVLILALTTRLLDYRAAITTGRWQRSEQFCLLDYPIQELHGKTLGIVGYGELGQAVAKVAQAFGMRVLLAARSDDERPGRIPLEQLLPQVDVLSLHCPLAPETHNLIGERELALMAPHALLINTARGGIVDEVAVLKALQGQRLAGAGIDVLAIEPPLPDSPLLSVILPNLIVTPHIAWASQQSRQRLVEQVAENVTAYSRGTPRNTVTS